MRSRNFVACLTLVFLISSVAFAQITETNRDTTHTFTIPDPVTFAGTSAFYDNFINLQAVSIGDSASFLWTNKSLYQGFNWQMLQGNYSLSYSLTGPNQYTGNVQAVNGLTDTQEISYSYPVGADFTQSFVTVGTTNGHYALNFSGGGTNGVNNGFPFFLTIVLPGDWSTQGLAQGDHNFISIDPNWTITENFLYDGVHTTFAAQELNFQGNNPNLQFQLIGGSAVPEPSSLLIFGSGVAGLLGLMRRRIR